MPNFIIIGPPGSGKSLMFSKANLLVLDLLLFKKSKEDEYNLPFLANQLTIIENPEKADQEVVKHFATCGTFAPHVVWLCQSSDWAVAFPANASIFIHGGKITPPSRVTGQTRAEMEALQAKQEQDYQEQYDAHQSQIPLLKMQWAKKGRDVLKPMYHEAWLKAVAICLGDIYMGTELEPGLEIAAALNDGKSLSDVMEIVRQQGLWSRPVLVARDICARGGEFAGYFLSNC